MGNIPDIISNSKIIPNTNKTINAIFKGKKFLNENSGFLLPYLFAFLCIKIIKILSMPPATAPTVPIIKMKLLIPNKNRTKGVKQTSSHDIFIFQSLTHGSKNKFLEIRGDYKCD